MIPLLLLLAAAAPATVPARPPLIRPRPKLPPLTTAIAMAIKSPAGETRAAAAQGAPPTDPRPLALVKSGDIPQIRWQVRNTDAKPVRDVVVHFLVTSVPEAGTAVPLAPRKGSLMDQVMGLTLGAKGTTSGNYNTAIYQPGFYLVEIELLDPDGNRRQYCTLDLKVE